MKTIAFLFLLLVVSSSNANTFYKETGWKLEPDRNGVYTVLPQQGRGGASTSGCTTVSCNRTGGVGGPVGKPRPTLAPTTTFPKANIAASALGLGSRLLPWVSTGYALYDWYSSAGLTVDQNGNPAEVTSPTTQKTGLWTNTYSDAPYPTPEAACNAYMRRFQEDLQNTSNPVRNPVITVNPWSEGQRQCQAVFDMFMYGAWGSERLVSTMVTQTSPQNWCYDSSDNPVVRPTGGLCPGGQPVPISQPQAQQKLADAPITADTLRRAFNEVLDAGGGVASTGSTVTGPASAPGETTTRTTTAPNGTTQVSTTTTNYNYTYNDNRVTVTETKTTQNPDGSTETETTDQPKDECARNPEALKCKELGQETGSPTWETKTVLFQAESLGLSGACPAPWVANLRGWNLTMSYQPVCDVAPTVRLGILAITALMCIFVVIRVTQS